VKEDRFYWTAQKIKTLVWMSLDGEPADAIARRVGCIERTVLDMQLELELRRPAFQRTPWTRKEKAIIRRRYPHEKTEKIAADLPGRTPEAVFRCAIKMGLRKTAKYLASPEACRLRRGDHVGRRFWYPKGHVPANKGLRRPGYAPGRMAETQFKKGQRTGMARGNWKPIGTILPDADGYQRIKVREAKHGAEPTGFGNTKVWPLLQRHVWEQQNGPIPAGHTIVFRDGNRANCDIANLEMISRADLMRRNTIHNRYPKEMVNTIMMLGAVKRKLREKCQKTQ
jgi:hypothetical protein